MTPQDSTGLHVAGLHVAGLSTLQAKAAISAALRAAGLVSAAAEAQQLLESALGLDRVGLLTRAEVLSQAEAQRLQGWVTRRMQREPLQHILGFVEWGGLRLEVSPAALIPRPETEVLLELAKAELIKAELVRLSPTGRAPVRVLDVGTGTGALALALRHWLNDRQMVAQVWASDVSPQALALARRNALGLGLELEFLTADLLRSAPTDLDLLVSNPPYLPTADALNAPPEVRRDPPLALYSGPDGLELARRLMQQAPQHLAASGAALLELDPRNVHTLAQELRPLWRVAVHPDLAGQDRFLVATLG